ncbi:MAG TPA: hypothetical protein VKB79_08750 [Bryobacteraceae bacterium]|nr:hypothetical protein [Bryobacteraceae bacterium]
MKTALMLFVAATAAAQPKVDNVLARMVPPGSTSLSGARMDQIKATEFYKRLVEQRKLPQVDRFAAETGFDPRRDVRELLFASNATGGVLLARGVFPLHPPAPNAKPVRHGRYTIQTFDESGFCVLDGTLAAAGDLKSLEAALDEWVSGKHTAAQPLLARARGVDPGSQFWGVATGFASFFSDNMPRAAGGVDFSKIFRGLQDSWFQADFTTGFKGMVHGVTATEQDAINLRDTAKGLIGFGRLSVPENQSEMLKLWDGITVDQEGRNVSIRADIRQNLVDRLVQILSAAPARGRGRGTPQ